MTKRSKNVREVQAETTNKTTGAATGTLVREVVPVRSNIQMIDITRKNNRMINETTEMIDVEDTGMMIIRSTIREIMVICALTITSICMVAEAPMKNTIAIMTTGLITMNAKRNWTTSMITIGIMMMSMTQRRIDKKIGATKMIPTDHLIIGKFARKTLVREAEISQEAPPGAVATKRGTPKTSAEIVKRIMITRKRIMITRITRGSSLMKNEIIGTITRNLITRTESIITTIRIKNITINVKSSTGMKRASFRDQKENSIRRKVKVRHHRKRRKSARIRPFSTNSIPMMSPQKLRTKSSTILERMNLNGIKKKSMKRIRTMTTIQLWRAVAHLVEVVQT